MTRFSRPPFTTAPLPVAIGADGTPSTVGLQRDTVTARDGTPYMERFTIHRGYDHWSTQLHHLLTDDPEPDPHDHPWDFTSVLLTGAYREITPAGRLEHQAPAIVTRLAETAHRLELLAGDMWTLVFTGPVRRHWGYHTHNGWVEWRTYRGIGR